MARDARLLAGLAAALLLSLVAAGSASARPVKMLPLAEHWDGSEWTEVAVPSGPPLSAVVAPAASDAWAFAYGPSRSAEHWDGSAWTSVSLPAPKGAGTVALVRAAATSAGDVWAVGSWEGGKSSMLRPLVEHWNGRAWKVVPTPPVGVYGALEGVTALSPTNVWAVGAAGVNVGKRIALRTLVLHWNGRKWARVPSPNPATAATAAAEKSDALVAVAGASARDVWAVGSYFVRSGRQHTNRTLALHWNGRRWTQVPSPSPGGNSRVSVLDAVTAVSATDVWAVGRYVRHGNRTLIEHWDGTRWRVVSSQGLGALVGIAALSPGDVWTVGGSAVGHWDGSAWSVGATLAGGDTLNAVAASSPGDVWAVGLRLKY